MAEQTSDFETLLGKSPTSATGSPSSVPQTFAEHANSAGLSKTAFAGQVMKHSFDASSNTQINYQNGTGIVTQGRDSIGFRLEQYGDKINIRLDAVPDGLSRGELGQYERLINEVTKMAGQPALGVAAIDKLSGKTIGPVIPIPEQRLHDMHLATQARQLEIGKVITQAAAGAAPRDVVAQMSIEATAPHVEGHGQTLQNLLDKDFKPAHHAREPGIQELLAKSGGAAAHDHDGSLLQGLLDKPIQSGHAPDLPGVHAPHHGLHGIGKVMGPLGVVGAALVSGASKASEVEGGLGDKAQAFAQGAYESSSAATVVKAVKEGHYKDATAETLASLTPVGAIKDMLGVRSEQQQAIIDALPKKPEDLKAIAQNPDVPPLDRHIADARYGVVTAIEQDNPHQYALASKALDQALHAKTEQTAASTPDWGAKALAFKDAIDSRNPQDPHLADFAKNHPDLASAVAIHNAALNSGNVGLVEHIDRNLISSIESGNPPNVAINAQVRSNEQEAPQHQLG